jgi:predicted Zn finger-like uncharacterized protein
MSQLIACPECKKRLQVPEDLKGKRVQCPECKHTFTAKAPEEDEESSKTGTTASKPAPSKTPEWDKKSSSSSSNRSGSGKKKPRDDDDDDDDDDDEDDDRPRRRRRRRSSSYRGNYMPHRGGMILAFGLIGLLVLPIFGIIAWVMGNNDLAEIRAGRMDPEGEGMTQAGRVLGMIAVVLWVVSILAICGIFGCIFMIGVMGAANAGRRNNFPPPRR